MTMDHCLFYKLPQAFGSGELKWQKNKEGNPYTQGLHRLNKSGPKVIKLFSCSTQPGMKLFLVIHVEMPIIVGISTFMSRKTSILGLSEPEKCLIS